ncbi:hypothetical protein [Estrella lausannensis]|uniref:Uncharacterized protein n=1 Tax=Estrella lausannensis TaxID=483423 RepID=A0A0H5DS36_9BACT|nr:hypothetical protein [Estrella lausannensis]CRX38544.1 hypothetical protein ELAC_1202 [Estrella lausannensis]
MNIEHLRPDRVTLDFNGVSKPPQRIDVDIILIEVAPEGYQFPKAYQCPIPSGFNESFEGHIKKNFSKQATGFLFLGDVEQFNRSGKMLLLCDGTFVNYQHLIVVATHGTSRQSSIKEQEESFYKALQSLSEAIRVRDKIGVKDILPDPSQESVRKLTTMTLKSGSSPEETETLAAIQSGGNPGALRETQNRLFELHP